MKKFFEKVLVLLVLCSTEPLYGQQMDREIKKEYFLIAHRGGVVDSVTAENSALALTKAAQRRYWMVEIDLRLTRDSVLIIHHDRNFKRYYGVDSAVTAMNWADIKKLEGSLGNKVLTFEDALRLSEKNGIEVMVDNKIQGNDTVLFTKVVDLLKRYDRLKHAMMIGTDESTAFFTGKVKLTCTREQLEVNMLQPGFNPDHYLLFAGNITNHDADWASKHKILAVGTINAWGIKTKDVLGKAGILAKQLKAAGVKYYQIDSMFDVFFK
ncbi:glycerophosphodiester phosphodiesterase [Pedobacter immunditicola]|uniref:glycerophosphodiester phosphodiesterase n=1 Tax=Pedobacter immunditicola TaxID=3133440 RepID=UPI0030A97DD4